MQLFRKQKQRILSSQLSQFIYSLHFKIEGFSQSHKAQCRIWTNETSLIASLSVGDVGSSSASVPHSTSGPRQEGQLTSALNGFPSARRVSMFCSVFQDCWENMKRAEYVSLRSSKHHINVPCARRIQLWIAQQYGWLSKIQRGPQLFYFWPPWGVFYGVYLEACKVTDESLGYNTNTLNEAM